MKLASPILVAAMLLGMAGAATAQDNAPPQSVTATASSPSATPTATGHIPAPPPGKSQVVFFRTGAMFGAAVWIKVRENGQELGKLSNQGYFVTILDPGPHTFTSAYELQDKLKMELDPGETYYVRGTLQSGLVLVGANLALVDEATFEKHYNHLHEVKSGPSVAEKPAS